MMHNMENILETRDYIMSKTGHRPVIGMILGSGLGSLADEIKNPTKIPYSEIPILRNLKQLDMQTN